MNTEKQNGSTNDRSLFMGWHTETCLWVRYSYEHAAKFKKGFSDTHFAD